MKFNRDEYYMLRNKAKALAHHKVHKVVSKKFDEMTIRFTSYEDGGISWTVHFTLGLRFDNYGVDGTDACTRLLEQAGFIWYM